MQGLVLLGLYILGPIMTITDAKLNETAWMHNNLRGISSGCMNCICSYGEQGGKPCPAQAPCHMDVGSLSCGPYQIKEGYWTDCGKPGGDWQTCTTKKPCSETCVQKYTERYGTYCTGGRTPTCEDYARIHNGGPKGCQKSATDKYWKKVKICCDKFGC